MIIPFAPFFDRVRSATDIHSQMDLARALGVNRSAITQAKVRDAVPQKWILALSRKFGLSPDWLEFGTGDAREEKKEPPSAGRLAWENWVRGGRGGVRVLGRPARPASADMVRVPKASANLCAGGGSFEVDATPVSAYPFPRWWLARMGSPSDMVFMDVVGESMEPTVYDGDTVLVDQGNTRLDGRGIYAVALGDAIYLKRVESSRGGVLLHSDNPCHSSMELFGDELEAFRVIGKVVWLCRDCR